MSDSTLFSFLVKLNNPEKVKKAYTTRKVITSQTD